MHDITILEEPITALPAYARIPSRFTVERILVVRECACGREFADAPVAAPWVKDYDLLEPPARWAAQWDLSRWGMLSAFAGDARAGGCLVAYDTDGVDLLEGRRDITALWDIRIAPAFQRRGIATRLFARAVAWSRERGCRAMRIETQDNNAAACRFYIAQGCLLQSVNPGAYPAWPDETQLIWQKPLA